MGYSTLRRNTQLQRHTRLKARAAIKRLSQSPTAQIKRNIQELLRQIVIKRDGGCIFRFNSFLGYVNPHLASTPACNGYAKDGHLILQADHLITRANSATFADPRLVVCVCKGHHGWKSVGGNARKAQYDQIVRQLLPKDRVDLWDRCEAESWRPSRKQGNDWALAEAALRAGL